MDLTKSKKIVLGGLAGMLITILLFFALYNIHKQKQIELDTFKMVVFSDLHYMSPELITAGKTFDFYKKNSARMADYSAPLWKICQQIIIPDGEEIVLLCGDLSNNGERQSHLEFIETLHELEKSGKRVFVVPGNNDIQNSRATAYRGDTLYSVPNISKKEFGELYADFGFDEAIARDSTSLSYVAAINKRNWLLALDDNQLDMRQANSQYGFSRPTIEWIKTQLRAAKDQDVRIFVMVHHGIVEHFMLQMQEFKNALLDDYRVLANLFADNGIQFVFSGHFHAMDITKFESLDNNPLYDIETGSMVASPFGFRRIAVTPDELRIKTELLPLLYSRATIGIDLDAAYLELMTQQCELRFQKAPYSFNKIIAGLVAPTAAKAIIAHYVGDEVPHTEINATLQMLRELNLDYRMDYLWSLYRDLYPADKDIILPIMKQRQE